MCGWHKEDEAHASGGRLVFAGSGRLCRLTKRLCLKRRGLMIEGF